MTKSCFNRVFAILLTMSCASALADPIPKSGDLEGSSAPVKPGTGGIKLEIGEVVK